MKTSLISSLIETAKLNAVDPQAYLTDVLTRIVSGHPQGRFDSLLPWAYAAGSLAAPLARRRPGALGAVLVGLGL